MAILVLIPKFSAAFPACFVLKSSIKITYCTQCNLLSIPQCFRIVWLKCCGVDNRLEILNLSSVLISFVCKTVRVLQIQIMDCRFARFWMLVTHSISVITLHSLFPNLPCDSEFWRTADLISGPYVNKYCVSMSCVNFWKIYSGALYKTAGFRRKASIFIKY